MRERREELPTPTRPWQGGPMQYSRAAVWRWAWAGTLAWGAGEPPPGEREL